MNGNVIRKSGKKIIDEMGLVMLDKTDSPLCVKHNKLLKHGFWRHGEERAIGWYCPHIENKNLKEEEECESSIVYSIV